VSSEIDPRRVQQALVCMLFDPKYAAAVRSGAPLPEPRPELGERERELLRGVDHRALATDDMRRARALQVILDEYPVSAALLGLDAVDRFFGSPAFRRCVFERGSMALAFGEDYVDNRAKGPGIIETAMARTRRPRPLPPGPLPPTIGRAPGVEVGVVPAGSLAWYQRARRRLGPEPLRALAKLRKPWSQKPPRRGREHLLIEVKGDGSIDLGTASDALVELLLAAGPARPRTELEVIAVELGAEPGEAGELLDDLLAEGLLRAYA
jgi:hypothetical protein